MARLQQNKRRPSNRTISRRQQVDFAAGAAGIDLTGLYSHGNTGRGDGSIQCLRHTYCSHLVMQGVNLRTVQVLAGHASYRTTERYAQLAPGHLQDAAKGMKL